MNKIFCFLIFTSPKWLEYFIKKGEDSYEEDYQ